MVHQLKEECKMLNTVEFGYIRVVSVRPSALFDTLIDVDLGGEWEFWYVDGEIVAWEIPT